MPAQSPITGLRAVILAGGLGTRLRSIIGTTPKALTPIRGVPFIDYLLGYLCTVGIRHVVLCTGFGHAEIEAHCGVGDRFGVAIRYSREHAPLGTGGALRHAADLVTSDPVVVLNGDSLVRADLSGFLASHQQRRANISLTLAEVPDRSRFGSVLLGPDAAITTFVEKGPSDAGWISAGMYLVNTAVLRAIPADQPVSLEKDVFPAYVGQGLFGYPTSDDYVDIGTPEALQLAEPVLTQSFGDVLQVKS